MGSYCYRIDRLFSKKPQVKSERDTKKTDETIEDTEEQELFVERIRLEKIELRLLIVFSINFGRIHSINFGRIHLNLLSKMQFFFHDSLKNLMSKMTIQEPTFDRMIVVYRYLQFHPTCIFMKDSGVVSVDAVILVSCADCICTGGLARRLSLIEEYL